MKKAILGVAIILAGCGDDQTLRFTDVNDAGEPTGTAEQAIYLPQPFGSEKGTESGVSRPICSAPWSGGECQAPSNKTLDIKFYASTCDSWWQGQVVQGWNEFLGNISGTGFSVITTGSPKYKVRCGSSVPGETGSAVCADLGALGGMRPSLASSGHDTQLGTLRHFSGGDIWICPSNFPTQGGSAWTGTTDARRKRAAANTVRHEMLHILFGHNQAGGNHIMNATANLSSSASAWYSVNFSFPSSMFNAAQCYDPTSDTTPDCPN